MKLVLTCEHGGNTIPNIYRTYFKNHNAVLNTHRGLDLGALDVFNHLQPLSSFSHYSEISRLLIELNRSLHHKNLFSEFSKLLSENEKEALITGYYSEYRDTIENSIKKYIAANKKVVHISVHSFTPVLKASERHCDLGLLYDSTRKNESSFCIQFKKEVLQEDSNLNVRFNYPYLGKSDGFTTYLRKQFPENYIGIELEVNQKFSSNNKIKSILKNQLYVALNRMKSIYH
ncbi:N-formylglutamate amidohydrolase [Polaribacter sp. ALD11]|uniref:N-formylglutamate amidohydrolase n=1 Tax=Polaribacter sp. ALD11 TaxID=2058137 RepID=UPI000C318333|nr:N-formylglutamate amidohydrolase [Polaribacter sp. ALD11]AUC85535.1 N-formylglutamate amidohydrolase [Polaribacter sp. ALD11]